MSNKSSIYSTSSVIHTNLYWSDALPKQQISWKSVFLCAPWESQLISVFISTRFFLLKCQGEFVWAEIRFLEFVFWCCVISVVLNQSWFWFWSRSVYFIPRLRNFVSFQFVKIAAWFCCLKKRLQLSNKPQGATSSFMMWQRYWKGLVKFRDVNKLVRI